MTALEMWKEAIKDVPEEKLQAMREQTRRELEKEFKDELERTGLTLDEYTDWIIELEKKQNALKAQKQAENQKKQEELKVKALKAEEQKAREKAKQNSKNIQSQPKIKTEENSDFKKSGLYRYSLLLDAYKFMQWSGVEFTQKDKDALDRNTNEQLEEAISKYFMFIPSGNRFTS